jgi:DNA-binding SARP family transcriptional activator
MPRYEVPCCPHCGAIAPPETGFHVDLDNNQLAVDGKRVAVLTPKQAEFLYVLASYPGKPVSLDKVMRGVWGFHPPPTARNILAVYATQVRKKLRPLGLDVFSSRRGDQQTLVLARIKKEKADVVSQVQGHQHVLG